MNEPPKTAPLRAAQPWTILDSGGEIALVRRDLSGRLVAQIRPGELGTSAGLWVQRWTVNRGEATPPALEEAKRAADVALLACGWRLLDGTPPGELPPWQPWRGLTARVADDDEPLAWIAGDPSDVHTVHAAGLIMHRGSVRSAVADGMPAPPAGLQPWTMAGAKRLVDHVLHFAGWRVGSAAADERRIAARTAVDALVKAATEGDPRRLQRCHRTVLELLDVPPDLGWTLDLRATTPGEAEEEREPDQTWGHDQGVSALYGSHDAASVMRGLFEAIAGRLEAARPELQEAALDGVATVLRRATVSADDAGWAHRVDTALRALEEAIESGNEGRDGDQASWPGGISDIGITPAVYDPRGITDRPASWGDDGDR